MTHRPTFWKTLRSNLGEWFRKMAPLMVLIGLMALFSVISPNFMTFNNLRLMLRQVSFATISAVGIMFVMISGAIDLSIGSQIVLTNIVTAILMVRFNVPPVIAIAVCLAMGTLLGMTNGFLGIKLKIHPLIITLGTATIYKGLGYIAADGKNINGIPADFAVLGQGYLGPVPIPVVIMAVVALIGSIILTRTYFGRYVFALGGNEEAARLAGVNINRMKIAVFAICGLASGITSVLLLSRVVSGQVSTGQGIEFDCLTAALLGGVSFKGGEGTIFGLIVGVLIIGVLNNAMQLAGLQDFYQNLVKGAVLLAAVGFDVYQKSNKAKVRPTAEGAAV
jgi:ribose/xylose/arabinose/galactoside ABC-type transport system permease subunit